MVKYSRAVRALRDVSPSPARSQTLCITLATYRWRFGVGFGRVIQREGTWFSDAFKRYAQSNVEDSRRVSRKLKMEVGLK